MSAVVRSRIRRMVIAAVLLAACAGPASAVMDIENRGPLLDAARFAFRPTNIGVLGNAFYDIGRSFDPSFEYPQNSGVELLHHAELWVGAIGADGHPRVSGGPMFEWRPTLDPEDHVRLASRGRPGSVRGVDDDHDGRIDEERLNGRDDDGDGKIDEDIALPADEMAASEYRDDTPEAINYGYPTGETHRPFGLEVHEEDYASGLPGFDGILGVHYTIINRGTERLTGVWLGLLADLDVRRRDDRVGQLDDVVKSASLSVTAGPDPSVNRSCPERLRVSVPVVVDGGVNSTLPVVAAVGLGHTTDPLATFEETRRYARAPATSSFRYSVFRNDLPAGQGGLPILDGERYAALTGAYAEAAPNGVGDPVVLIRCGPFPTLEVGQSLDFDLALCATPVIDSMEAVLAIAATMYAGFWQNRLRDSSGVEDPTGPDRTVGATGKNGHEVCMEVPAGVSVSLDPECVLCMPVDLPPDPVYVTYQHGQCVWTNADCDFTTGTRGRETQVHWLDPGAIPTSPAMRAEPGDHRVTIEWDNQPEVLLAGGDVRIASHHFDGYRLYRLSDWRNRRSNLPPPERWELLAAFGPDSLDRQRPLSGITDSTVASDGSHAGVAHYPVGRYRYVDTRALNGFDYVYVVSTVASSVTVDPLGFPLAIERVESPFIARLDSVVVPHKAAGAAGAVWVVPNPYRAHAAWDRPPIGGDPFGRHVDFMGLPRARATIRIWTLAGDFVAQIDHDGRDGNGEAPWDLISRHGQDVESGIYLFTVDSPLGHQVGRFVIIR